jgi:hypothetical protein
VVHSFWRNRDFRETTRPSLRSVPSPQPPAPSPQSSDSVIRTDYLVNDDQIGGGTQQRPRIAFDGSGNCIVAWEDFRNGNADALAQRFDNNGNKLGPNFRACDDPDMWWQGEPAPGAQRNGSFLVAWEDRKYGGSDVIAQRYDAAGVPVDTAYRINDDEGHTDQRAAAVTTLPDGRTVVAWEDWRNDIGDIYAQVLSTSGQPVGMNFRVNAPPDWQQYGASVDSDSLGRFVIAWESGITGWDIYAQRYNAQAQPQGPNFMVNDDPNRSRMQWGPSVAMAPGGSLVIAWHDFREDTLYADIYAQRYDTAGQPQGANFRVNDSVPGASHSSASVAFDASGNFFVCWSDTRGGQGDIYAQAFNPDGQRLGPNFKINDDIGPAHHGDPYVRFHAHGEFWIFWTDARDGNNDIYGQRLALENGDCTCFSAPEKRDCPHFPMGPNFRVNDDSFSTQQRVPSVVANDQGLTMTIWEDERNTNCDVYCQLSDPLGNPIGANQKANDDNVGASHFYATAAIDPAGNSITAWTDGRSGYHIYGQGFGPTGNRAGANFRVNDGGSFHWSPVAAKDSNGNSVIIFSDDRAGGIKIFGQRYNPGNNPIGGNFRVSDDTGGGWQQYASAAMNRHGRFVAVWMEDRDGGSIYGQLYDSAGDPVGPNFRANDNTINSYHGYPGVACDPQGNFTAVWEDARDAVNVNIYGQRFDANGNRLGANFKVNDDPPGSDHWGPSCAIDAQGRLVVVWTEWRPPRYNPQIYAQRFNPDGSKVGASTVINEPDLFYYNNHWTMQRSVAAAGDRWVFSWTENRRHRGWDNYNKITDWNLLPIAERREPLAVSRQLLAVEVRPNPVAGMAQVRLTTANWGHDSASCPHLSLDLFDVSGRWVARLFNGRPRAAELSVPLNARNLSNGAYFLVARTPREKVLTKLVVEGVR